VSSSASFFNADFGVGWVFHMQGIRQPREGLPASLSMGALWELHVAVHALAAVAGHSGALGVCSVGPVPPIERSSSPVTMASRVRSLPQ